MNSNQYRRMTNDDFVGRLARTICQISNGYGTIGAGQLVVIKRKYGGFEVESVPCRSCGLQLRITRVSAGAIDLVDGGDPDMKQWRMSSLEADDVAHSD